MYFSDLTSRGEAIRDRFKEIREKAESRQKSIDLAYVDAVAFWEKHPLVMSALNDLKDTIGQQEPVTLEPMMIIVHMDNIQVCLIRISCWLIYHS